MNSIFTFQNLYGAYLDCRKRKRNTINAIRFEADIESNLFGLLNELKQRIYVQGASICFAVDKPVIREVFAADFRDRVVHHLFVRTIESHFEKYFIYDNYACRKGKGTLFGVRRLQKFVRRIQNLDPRNYNNWHYLKADISGFFMHINKEVLRKLVFQKISTTPFSKEIKSELKWLAEIIISHDPTKNYKLKGDPELLKIVPRQKSLFHVPDGAGLPIGNLTSQFFANVYLNELDQFIKRKLKCEFYGRYVDDFYIIRKDKEMLKEFHDAINEFLRENLFLELNLKKCYIRPLSYGIDFIGYFVKPWRMYARRRVVKVLKSKLWIFEKYGKSDEDKDKIKKSMASYFGHFKHAKSFRFLEKIKEKHPWIKQANPKAFSVLS
ncbi:reverse transcriptase [Candidatus Falkowbacteria bacterium CG11_big_fil_rev_8_21_14_0_20_39_10]|uniref:Reverse transcriptase n=1 Tax=Candidatus Falkowbacteria bacterium CG11_big_fil_rev_8_21_14_0_20_39_10 TaxID=1974570 RepID=A0A2M6K868_9BACT|nr:MAG: reverse transcriptase [Candidatus Falkowbacteria bacterium CG11_big_fil_rev_8_21_14_0_20_39_10]